MERKLIKQGIGGLTFYVPSKWGKERNLKPGDLVDISELDDKLILSSKKIKKKQEIEITINDESKEFIRNYLNQLYRLGYDKIKINSSDEKQLLLCQKFVQMFLLGFEIVEVKKDHFVAENISEPSEEKESAILRRMFLLIENSFSLALEDLANGKQDKKEDMERNTRKVTQYDNFLRRNMVKQNLAFGKQFFYWEFYNYLLLIQHVFFHLYQTKANLRDKKAIVGRMEELSKNFSGIYQAFFNKDQKSLDKVQSKANKLYEDKTDSFLNELARLQYLVCSPIISILQMPGEV
ncbi:hypothetical protein KA107_03225 [Candidatus Pacearchaeota archaeon]|nr:hypothetical protein [Candidatus Pacearchaeota archaeon]